MQHYLNSSLENAINALLNEITSIAYINLDSHIRLHSAPDNTSHVTWLITFSFSHGNEETKDKIYAAQGTLSEKLIKIVQKFYPEAIKSEVEQNNINSRCFLPIIISDSELCFTIQETDCTAVISLTEYQV